MRPNEEFWEADTKRYEKQAIAYTATCHGIVHVLELTYGAVLLNIAKDFGVNFSTLGGLATIFGFTFGLSALPFGFLGDRIDPKKLLVICCLGMSLSSVGMGLAPSIGFLTAAIFFLGLTLGIYHPTGASYISRSVSRTGVGFGLQGVGGNLGIALGPLLAGQIAFLTSWRAAYFTFAVPPLVLAALILFSRTNGNGTEIASANAGLGASRTEAKDVSVGIWKKVVVFGKDVKPYAVPLTLLFSAQVMMSLVYRGLVTFLPAYLSQEVGSLFPAVNKQLIASYASTLILFFGVIGQFVGGQLSERVPHGTLGAVVNFLSVPMLFFVGKTTGVPLIVIAAAFAFFHFMSQPVYNTLVTDFSPRSRRGAIFGLYFFFNFSLGAFSAGVLGTVADRVGLNWVFLVSSVFGVMSVVFFTALWLRTLRQGA